MSTPKTILVVDIEATCWKDKLPYIFPEPRNEIIEIGIAVIDIKTKTLVESRSIIVIPPTTEISDFCTELTTLTPEFIQTHGIPFKDAMDICRNEYKMHRNVFASWGDYDRRSFEKNCKWNGVENPVNNLNLNIKALFSAKMGYNGGQAKCGEDLGIQMEGTAHRGIDDAVNTAKILIKLI